MTTTSHIRRLLNALEAGDMISTRDCLNFGRRAAVDQALYRLVKDGFLKRLARGLFLKLEVPEHVSRDASLIPSLIEIVKAKAKAFHRKIFVHGEHAQHHLEPPRWTGVKPSTADVFVFATDGATTSFKVLGKRVYLKRHAPRKVALQDRLHGMIIRALWCRGKDALTPTAVQNVFMSLKREESALLRRVCSMMPSWMSDRLVFARGSKGTNVQPFPY
jgi:hypothetical protein